MLPTPLGSLGRIHRDLGSCPGGHSNQTKNEGQARGPSFQARGVFWGGWCQQMERGLWAWAKSTTRADTLQTCRLSCGRVAQEMGRKSPRPLPLCVGSQLCQSADSESARCLSGRRWTTASGGQST